MDDFSSFFAHYSDPNLCIEDIEDEPDGREVIDRSRCSICQKKYTEIPRYETGSKQFCWCVECNKQLDSAVAGNKQFYSMWKLETKPRLKLGDIMGFSGYCALLRHNKLRPIDVETDHPCEKQMQERWYNIDAKVKNSKQRK